MNTQIHLCVMLSGNQKKITKVISSHENFNNFSIKKECVKKELLKKN